jgi:hypothetical protein
MMPTEKWFTVFSEAQVYTYKFLGSFDLLFRRLRDHRLKTINPEPYYNALLGLSLSLNMTHLKEELFRYGPENYQEL